MSTTNYGAANAAATSTNDHRDQESQALLNGANVDTAANDAFYGRAFAHVSTHRKRYFAAWLAALVIAISTALTVHYLYKKHEDGHHHTPSDGDELFDHLTKPEVCRSDRSYPITILLSIFFGYIAIDRFYLGYIISSLLKLVTAGGFGVWYIVDIILIVVGSLPDHNGCKLVAP